MSRYLLIAGLALCMNATAVEFASAYHRHHYRGAPYGYGHPAYSSRYGTYPSYTYDPDPRLRSQLRSDFNRGVDFPGGR